MVIEVRVGSGVWKLELKRLEAVGGKVTGVLFCGWVWRETDTEEL
jgi:hypothetical protein